ncbi:MAG TPA: hypothetical protein VFB79_02120 [Candidatus Angelobacter sp.]|nr:hypothetical protein [Candidatus Angelobacter sp.]
MKIRSGFILVLMVLLAGQSILAQDAVLARTTNFAAYLTNKPWVNQVDVALSKNRYYNPLMPPEYYQGYSIWKASLQPNGFFFQVISNNPFYPPTNNAANLTFGESTKDYWTVGTGISYAPKESAEGGSPKNSREIICRRIKQWLVDILNLGLEGIDTDSIEWTDSTNFSCGLLDDQGEQTRYKGYVSILASEGGLPTLIHYSTSFKTNETNIITCRYKQHSLPPSEVMVQKRVLGRGIVTLTNVIINISFGLRKGTEEGFLPSDFVPPDMAVKSFIVESNGSRFELSPDGHYTKIDETLQTVASVGHTNPERFTWILAVALLIGITISLIIYHIFNARQTTRKLNTPN